MITTSRITIVGQPPAPTNSTQTVCNGTTPNDFSISGATAGSTVNWYANVSAATPKVVGTVGSLITTTVADGSGNGTLSVASAFPGFTNTVADNYIVWASYVLNTGASNGVLCESPLVAVTRSIREALPTPGTISGTASLCDGTIGVTFSLASASGSTTIGGTTQYVWSYTPTGGVTINSPNAQSTTVDFNIGGVFTTATRTIRVREQYTTGGAGLTCPSSFKTFPVTVMARLLVVRLPPTIPFVMIT